MTKKIIYSLAISTILLTGTIGCNNFLDVKPIVEKPDEGTLSIASNVEKVLFSAYNKFQVAAPIAMQIATLYGDDVDLTKGFGLDVWENEFKSQNYTMFNQIGQNYWENAYSAIASANLVIDATDKNLYKADVKTMNQWKGEALFLRALFHFDITRLFSLPYNTNPTENYGAILRLAPTNSVTVAATKVQRAKVSESYEAVIKDLIEAITLLPNSNTNNRVTSATAKALLARVYFNKADYANAFKQADEVIKTGGFKINAATDDGLKMMYNTVGNLPTPAGVILQVVNSSEDDASGSLRDNKFFNISATHIKYLLSQSLINDLKIAGARRNSLFVLAGFNAANNLVNYSNKYALRDNGTTAINIPYLRLAEIYLIRAESGLQTDAFRVEEARADMNTVRFASQAQIDNATSNKETLLNFIRRERNIELFLEGDRWHEQRRLQATDIRNGVGFDSKKGLLKIPESEYKGNVGIEQN
jgi:starch-binding outer membrane protein, SusD/RagB family